MTLLIAILLLVVTTNHANAIDFSVSNPSINDLYVTVDASISGTATNYYLQGVLRKEGSSKYFGETLGSQGTYLDYISSPDKDFISTNFISTIVQNASWSGQLKMRYKADDPLYQGPGTYELKLRRFTGASSNSAGESNTLIVNLSLTLPTSTPSPSPSPIASPTPSPSPSPSISPSPSLTAQPTSLPIMSSKPDSALSPSPDIQFPQTATVPWLATVSASTIPSPPNTSKNQIAVNNTRLKVVLGVGAGFLSIGSAAYLYLRKKKLPV